MGGPVKPGQRLRVTGTGPPQQVIRRGNGRTTAGQQYPPVLPVQGLLDGLAQQPRDGLPDELMPEGQAVRPDHQEIRGQRQHGDAGRARLQRSGERDDPFAG